MRSLMMKAIIISGKDKPKTKAALYSIKEKLCSAFAGAQTKNITTEVIHWINLLMR